MTADTPIWKQLRSIRNADLSTVDRELLRPAFAALDGGQIIAVPPYVAARIRDIAARLPKQ